MAVAKRWDATAGEWVVEPDWFYYDSVAGGFERGIGKYWDATAGEWVSFTQLLIDNFEDGNLVEYMVDGSGTAEVNKKAALSGTYGLETRTDYVTMWSRPVFDNTLENYPAQGDTWEFYIRPLSDGLDAGDEQYWHIFGKTNNFPDDNQYTVELINDGTFRIRRMGGQNGVTTVTVAGDFSVPAYTVQTYRIEVTWDDGTLGGSAGDMTAILEAEDGTQITTITGNDTTWDAGGIGWRQSGASTAGHAYYDDCYILPQ